MSYNPLDAYPYGRPEQYFYSEFTDNYASTSSWTPHVEVKQEPMSLYLPSCDYASWPPYIDQPYCWSPYTDTPTPDLHYSSPACSDHNNVFDAQFAQSLQGGHSPTPSLSPEPVTPPLLKQRPLTDDDSSRRRHPCLIPGCLRRFTSQYTLKVHMQAHQPKPRVSFLCTLGCGERFSRQHDRLRHEVAKHNKVCEFSCDACGRFFSTAKTLGNHKCPLAQGGTRWVHH